MKFPVVALGGSAGGLDAFFQFFEALERAPNTPACAIVVVLHLSADAESSLPELLASRTRLPVEVVDERSTIEAGRVYVLRPGVTFGVDDGALVTHARAHGAAHHPVDDLFRGLADAFGDRTIAIVCSGTGANGSASIGAVREAGGCVIAQDPITAAFEAMPSRAIATGLVDVVAAPGDMIAVIGKVARRLAAAPAADSAEGSARSLVESVTPDALGSVLATVRSKSAIDFTPYKKGTLYRRIERRMRLHEIGKLGDYADFLAGHADEVDRLVDDLLITVTSFFRDAEAWRALGDEVLDPMLAERRTDDPIRVWVAGCATGEEAYSIAIALLDRIERLNREIRVEIFASDVSKPALARARQGEYPAASVDRLPRRLRERWFDREGDTVRVKQSLREIVLFAQHNLLQDPPFSNTDLIICRNVLIYLASPAQNRLLRLFHFSLRERGALFLGSAEGTAEAASIFQAVNGAARIFRRSGNLRLDTLEFPFAPFRRRGTTTFDGEAPYAAPVPRQPAIDAALKALMDRHAPPSVAIDESAAVIYAQGAIERFLRLRPGAATHDILSLCHPSLTATLRRSIDKARDGGGDIVRARVKAELDDGLRSVLLEIAPTKDASGILLVSFLEEAPLEPVIEGEASDRSREAELEDEIRLLRDELNTTIWSARRAGEDLKAYNEEMTSMNEELRATNEELETSKEELQSLNEELRTVNAQLQIKLTELNEKTSDLDNLLTSTNLATLFVGDDLDIRWFSPPVEDLFHIRDSDIGRQLAHVVRRFRDDTLEADCRRALREAVQSEAQIESIGGSALIRRVLPYRTREGRVTGAVVTFTDVTEIHNARRYAERIVETVPVPIIVLDPDYRVVSANPAFCTTFAAAAEDVVGRMFESIDEGRLYVPELRHLLRSILPDDGAFSDLEMNIAAANGGRRDLRVSGRRLDHIQQILLIIDDITEAKAGQALQLLLISELRHRVKNSLAVVQGLASSALRRATDLDEFRSVFQGRLRAYAAGHDQLLENDWRSVDLHKLATAVIKAHGTTPDRLSIAGPPFAVSAKQALALSLILHELETNALKYGSLSVDEGTIDIRWTLGADHTCALVWREVGGPAAHPPEREGFGTALVRQLVRFELGGNIEMDFTGEGLSLQISFPVEEVSTDMIGAVTDERSVAAQS